MLPDPSLVHYAAPPSSATKKDAVALSETRKAEKEILEQNAGDFLQLAFKRKEDGSPSDQRGFCVDTKNNRAVWFVHIPQNVSSDRILRAKKPLNKFCCIAGAGKTDKEREKSG